MPENKQTPAKDPLWYKDAVIYELHIKAFHDSNNDGIGDFRGLVEKLDYLQNLGITAIWVLPFYPSPLKDDGYDIADYYSINPAYGDLDDFRHFLDEAHKRNLKVITELVINHTSDQHPWFKAAQQAPKGSPERNRYVWTDDPQQYKDVRIIFQDFEASNWTWDPIAAQYYWHRFFHHQPDLNFDNPEVQEEIFRILDYWCKMGVDGFRLDAIPYLFEREGTNGENLPETHAFLKKLRRHVDEHYPGTLLLAEANMWPEDSASYFGNGDECHMNYHFPVMPRIFMSLQMEDRHPITDIFEQTPEIPDNCQWAIFLRNHDELTLEMVTDEERDYMYKVYVKDPKARINLGIRHRLAPLMSNNRRKIELLNYLLFSLPGTPVLYYGDEIGMGDNFYLGDRDGVRTPMQWSDDRNAGFSKANPHKLYLPVILDPDYHYESVNVEMQSRNSSSLLWWTRHMIQTRKKFQAFSRGDMQFINVENAKILAFTRTYQDETILVMINLSRYMQAVEIDLSAFKGYTPMEVFSRNKLPVIKEEPYFFTLSAYNCQWFILEKAQADTTEKKALPVPQLQSWDEFQELTYTLEHDLLPAYLMQARWFGGKGRAIQGIRMLEQVQLPLEKDSAHLLLIEVQYQSNLPEYYQLAVAFARNEQAATLQDQYPKSIISHAVVHGEEGVLYDALFGEELQQAIIAKMSKGESIKSGSNEISFYGSRLLEEYMQQHPQVKSKIMAAEQSNTSLNYDNKFFLKIYRKVDQAINPDLELTRFLTEKAGFGSVPAFAGAIEWKHESGSNMVLGMMQEMVENNGDAWSYMLHQLQVFYDKVLAEKSTELPELRGTLTSPVVYEEVPEQIKRLLNAALGEQAELLGVRTAEMHLALASDHESPELRPEPFSLHYQRSLFSSFQSLLREAFENLDKNTARLSPSMQKEARELASIKTDITSMLRNIYRRKLDVVKMRTHGDYHLGQVLFTGKDFVIIDFEGEPARTYSERRLKRSPLRDVAGMIRSFHYAAYAALFLDDRITDEDREKLIPFAEQWYHYMSGFFLKAYLDRVKDSDFVPDNEEDLQVLLQTFLLEKAIYELSYELNNRPGWVIIPLRGIRAVMDGKTHTNADKHE